MSSFKNYVLKYFLIILIVFKTGFLKGDQSKDILDQKEFFYTKKTNKKKITSYLSLGFEDNFLSTNLAISPQKSPNFYRPFISLASKIDDNKENSVISFGLGSMIGLFKKGPIGLSFNLGFLFEHINKIKESYHKNKNSIFLTPNLSFKVISGFYFKLGIKLKYTLEYNERKNFLDNLFSKQKTKHNYLYSLYLVL